MDQPTPEIPQPAAPPDPAVSSTPTAASPLPVAAEPQAVSVNSETRFLRYVFLDGSGLRSGWSLLIFLGITFLFMAIFGTAAFFFTTMVLHQKFGQFGAISSLVSECTQVLALLVAAAICAMIERRRILDYNLRGPHRLRRFLEGAIGGVLALTALIGVLYAGNWLHFGPVALSGAAIFTYAALWGLGFLFTGFSEEGLFRCYMQFTLTRGINFWWAFGLVGSMCLSGALLQTGEGIWGVYLMAALGLIPCFLLHRAKSFSAGFWQAAWVTSTGFGFIHTGNHGETWIGIFSAAAIGFIFCVSIRLTGSAWWAIGFHASWDWAQTYLYGTADSGFQPKGHYFTSIPSGSALWSGGTDGPEGSLLVIPTILVTLLAIVLIYGRRGAQHAPLPQAAEQNALEA
jgi:membrane protease YdiL (CAAX protease family)